MSEKDFKVKNGLQVVSNVEIGGNIVITGTVDGRNLSADGSKLDGIESGADVTDTTNVTAAGALMDSEITNLSAVKTFDPTDYATAAQGSLADTATQPGDNISTLTNDAGYITGGDFITEVIAGTDLTGGGTSGNVTISHANTSSLSGTYGSVSDGIKIDQITVDARGHVTAVTTGTTGLVSDIVAGSGLTGGGSSSAVVLDHADTSTQTSVNNSGTTVIQDVTLDGFGHITNLGSTTITLADLGYTGSTSADNYSSWSARDADGTTYTITSGDILQFAEGTGIDVNFTADDVITITNTAPDQTVTLTGGTNVTVTGTYPNFTITSTDTNTTYSPGTLLDLAGTTFNVDLSELADMTATMLSTDEFVVLDAGTQRRKQASEIGLSVFSNDAGFSTTNGTVTSVSASGGTGISISGSPITTSGTLIITNTAPDQTVVLTEGSNITITGTYPNFTIAATDTNTTYSAGTALDLSGTTFNVDLSELSTSTTDGHGDFFIVVDSVNAQRKLTKSSINISGFNNDAGFTTNVGDITGVTAGSGLTGGGISGTVTLNHADTSSQASLASLSGASVVSDIGLDTYGHVTNLSTRSLTLADLGYTGATNADAYGAWDLFTDGTSRGQITSGENVNFIGGTNVSLSYSVTNNSITFNSTDTTYSAGNGIDLSGTTFSVSAGTGLTQSATGLSVTDNGIGATQLNVSGNGNVGQALLSDGDGSFSWGEAGSSVTISDTEPTSPSDGNLWWDSDIGRLFIYYTDVDSSQWVETSPNSLLYDTGSNTHTLTGSLTVTGDINSNSDKKLKQNIKTFNNGLYAVKSLRGVRYSWIDNGKPSIGLIAQEVEKVLPELVSQQNNIKSVQYGNIVAVLVEAVKELSTKVEQLERSQCL